MYNTSELEYSMAQQFSTPNLVLLYSGGLDSTLLLKMALQMGYQPIALLVDYGQRHKIELEKAEDNCIQHKVPFVVCHTDLPNVDSALTGSQKPGMYKGVSEWHVPGRNLIFLGLAASLAESRGINKIWFGPNMEDRNALFVDCYQDWVYYMNKVLERTASIPLELEAPLLGMRKSTIKALAGYFKIDGSEIWSGYAVK